MNQTIGDRIALIRGRESRTAFGSRYGLHRNTIDRWEKGDRQPDVEFLQRLIADNGIAPEWMMSGIGPMKAEPDAPQSGADEFSGWGGEREPSPEELKREWKQLSEDNASLAEENTRLVRMHAVFEGEIKRLEKILDERPRIEPAQEPSAPPSLIEEMEAVEAKLLKYHAPEHIIREALVAVLEARSGRDIGRPKKQADYESSIDKKGLAGQRVAEDTAPFGKEPTR